MMSVASLCTAPVGPACYSMCGQDQTVPNPFITGELRRLTEFLYNELSKKSQVLWSYQTHCAGPHRFPVLEMQPYKTGLDNSLLSYSIGGLGQGDVSSNRVSSMIPLEQVRGYDSTSGVVLHSLRRCATARGDASSRGILRRAVFTEFQREGLELAFTRHAYITKPDRKALAEQLGLKDTQVCSPRDSS